MEGIGQGADDVDQQLQVRQAACDTLQPGLGGRPVPLAAGYVTQRLERRQRTLESLA